MKLYQISLFVMGLGIVFEVCASNVSSSSYESSESPYQFRPLSPVDEQPATGVAENETPKRMVDMRAKSPEPIQCFNLPEYPESVYSRFWDYRREVYLASFKDIPDNVLISSRYPRLFQDHRMSTVVAWFNAMQRNDDDAVEDHDWVIDQLRIWKINPVEVIVHMKGYQVGERVRLIRERQERSVEH